MLGIQPSLVAFGYRISPAVEQALVNIHARLRSGAAIDAWPWLVCSSGTRGEETPPE
jgi:hypothetical protein